MPYQGSFVSEFKKLIKPEELPASQRMRKGRLTIAPPIVIDIETLQGMEASIEHNGFFQILDDYLCVCSDGSISFGDFMAGSKKYEQHFKPRRSVQAKAIEALHASARQFFPEANGTLQ